MTSEIADGPGGGGAGGMIAFTSGTPQQDVSGGLSGVTNSSFMTNFPVNGATGGADGLMNRPTVAFDILVENDTICSGESTTLTATTAGNLSDRKSTRLNSSHVRISYAVFCLKKKK